jgi:hypothetical protein
MPRGSCGGLSGGSGRSNARCWLNAARAPARLPEAQAEAVARDVGLDYCTAVRGILTRLARYGDSSTLTSDTPAMVQQ